MANELVTGEADQDSEPARMALALLLETRARPLARAFTVCDPDKDGYVAILTATRIHGKPMVYELAALGCDPVLLEDLLAQQSAQQTH